MKNTETTLHPFLRGLILVLVVLGFSGLASPASAGTYEDEIKAKGATLQNTDQIKALFSGNTYEALSSSGKEFAMYMDTGGKVSIRITIHSSKEIFGKGVWSVEKDQFCRKWENLRDKELRCRRVYKNSDGSIDTIVSEDGAFSSKGKFWKGNPQRL